MENPSISVIDAAFECWLKADKDVLKPPEKRKW
jgi:hypothetical protein